MVAAAKAGLDKAELNARWPRENEIPFSSETKRMTTLHEGPQGVVAYAKGAPEVILGSCTRQLTDEASRRWTRRAGRRSWRPPGRWPAGPCACWPSPAKKGPRWQDAERDMTFLGLVGMIDPPRPEAKAGVETCEQAGIKTVMITGDHPVTAQAVARELGIVKTGRVITGPELEALPQEDFEKDVEAIEVYARVSPAHKLRVVTALQKKDHIVAMTGDGVNDAPALKKADIGIAMGITGHRRDQGSRGHDAHGRQLRLHRRGGGRRPHHLRQHQEVPDVPAVVEHRRNRPDGHRLVPGAAACR